MPQGGLDLDVLIDGEQGGESGGLLVGEQVGTGVQGSPGTVERVVLTAAAAGRGGSSPLAVAEKKGTMILLALGRARWASEIWGVISLPPYGSPGTWPDEDAGCPLSAHCSAMAGGKVARWVRPRSA
jgi:hypothetical protein